MTVVVSVRRDVTAKARLAADAFRQQLGQRGTLIVNVLSSPGAGKTSLLAETARRWGGRRKMAVLVGDIETDRDAQRLAPLAPTVQLTTGGACHLELPLVQQGWDQLAVEDPEFLFIENIGNLVCPSSHDLGEHLRVVMLSATEGDDKPGKYPKAFRTSQALVISKCDLLPYVPFSVDAARQDAQAIQPDLFTVALSALSGEGVADWIRFLEAARQRLVTDGPTR